MMINKQRAEQQLEDPDTILVHHVWATMQGEGPHAGRPAVFVRLTGCNIRCPACDTDYTSQRNSLSPVEVVEVVRAIRQSGLVVLTGGEPLRQDITKLVRVLLDEGYEVQIETNGTVYRDLPFDNKNFMIVCSPKTTHIDAQLAQKVSAWKYVMDADHVDVIDGLPTSVLLGKGYVARPPEGNEAPVYLQPLDVEDELENSRNLKAVVCSCMTNGYRLCLQVHKIIGLE